MTVAWQGRVCFFVVVFCFVFCFVCFFCHVVYRALGVLISSDGLGT